MLFFFALYIALGVGVIVALVRLFEWRLQRKSHPVRIVVGVVIAVIWLLIPTYDVILGKWEWRNLCEAEAGVTVYEPIYLGPEWWREDGRLMFLGQHGEFMNKCQAGGTGSKRQCPSPQLPYVFEVDRDQKINNNFGRIGKVRFLWKNEDTGQLHAELVRFYWSGGWLAKISPVPVIPDVCQPATTWSFKPFHYMVFKQYGMRKNNES